METEERPLRGCELCGGVDTAPRHIVATPEGQAGAPDDEMLRKLEENGLTITGLAQLLATDTQVRHMDCCAAAGCPAEPGKQCGDAERAGSGLQNDALLMHIRGGA